MNSGKMKKKRANPLYVVTEKGSVVEEATSRFDALVKKWGLTGLMNVIEQVLKELMSVANSYPMVSMVKSFVDDIVLWLTELANKMRDSFGQYVPL